MATCKKSKEWSYFKLCMTTQDKDIDQENVFDEMTWRQWISNALKRSHGIFGEGIEYYIIKHDDKTLYVKVFYKDSTIFSQAISTYISSDELVGRPLIVSIVLETSNTNELSNDPNDKLWVKRLKEEIRIDAECAEI
ncbi:hypothetical protein C6P45_001459 [Maudiozyma exigua]|uniref:Ribonucleases P/MRP subunit Pop8-like domain-containing protein n=1 Tax=Maudiozyma exigua TaxID=34358 RepID=A0A9P6W2T7_MAUEX|nr:hypothetical protein C6P45_001459 [Kazachstania exigua]